jgi:eukaryotic-like serine/threonine-protein kinase
MRFASGARLGPFEILTPLGAGGMGEVYRARDTRLDRTVALKILPSELVSAPNPRVERFRHEARVIARITHPNICTLHDIGEDGRAIFLVMEYVDGHTLGRRLEDGPMPLPFVMRTAIGIADALDHAHRHGVVHRDIKPTNVMLTRDSVKLLDFGLAKLKERDEEVPVDATRSARLTEVGAIVGTVPYMAPEQIEGRDVDARTDIFSFGVVLYEMIGGRRPFEGNSRASVMAAIVAAEPPPLSSLQPRTPASLERLIRRCLAKDPEDRWQTARDMAAELRWIAEETPGTIPAAATKRWPRRGRLWGGVAAAGLTAAVLAAIASSLWPRPSVAEYLPATFRKGAVSSARFTPDGLSFVYSASWEGQPYAAFLGRPANPDARDLQMRDARIMSISRAGDMAVLFGPQNITHTWGLRTLARIPMAGGSRRDILSGVVDADWIPGTDALAVIRDTGDNRPWTVEFPAGKTVHETRAAWSLRVSPDGRHVAFFEGPVMFGSAPQAMITVVDRSGRKSTVARDWAGFGLAWAPSGTEIWFTATRPAPGEFAPSLHAVSLSGVERPVYRAADWLVLHDISSDGRALLTRNTIRINLTCQRPGETSERDLTWQLASAAKGISPDGKTVIFEDELLSSPSGNPLIFSRNIEGAPAIAMGEGSGATLSPDGKWVLALRGEDLVLLPTGVGATITLPKGELARVGDGAWLPDSKRIVFTGYTGDNTPRGYLQEIPAGLPRAITPSGVVLADRAAAPDENAVLGRAGATWALFPIQGGDDRPVPALTPGDLPLQWSHGGRYLYTVASVEGARQSAIGVSRVEVASGSRTVWKTLRPSDPVGVEDMRETLVITPDAQSYCYSYMRRLGDLFVVGGLK